MDHTFCRDCDTKRLSTDQVGVFVCPSCGDMREAPKGVFAALLDLLGMGATPSPPAVATDDEITERLRGAMIAAIGPMRSTVNKETIAECLFSATLGTTAGIAPLGGAPLYAAMALLGATGNEAAAIAILRIVAAKMRLEAMGDVDDDVADALEAIVELTDVAPSRARKVQRDGQRWAPIVYDGGGQPGPARPRPKLVRVK